MNSAPASIVPVAICIPVRNEQATLPELLNSLAAQALGNVRAAGCFFLDGCTDGTAALLQARSPFLPFPIHFASGPARLPNAGIARAAAMAIGLRHVGNHPRAALLTTDADSRPRSDWVAAAVHALTVADVAAGRIVRIDGVADALQTRVERYYDRLHALRRAIDPVAWEARPTSHYSAGANMAMRAEAYVTLGGFKPMSAGEDATLLDDAARAGLRVRRDAAMVVHTSSRRDGRAPGGLAAALRAIDGGDLPQVAHPLGTAWQYRAHAAARGAFERMDDTEARRRLGDLIGLDGDHVLGVWRDCPNAEAFAMRLVPAPTSHPDSITLDEAEIALAALERGMSVRAA